MDLNIHDLEAAGDVFDAIAEASDSMSTEEALGWLRALRSAQSKLRTAESLIETQLKRTLDSPVQIEGQVYMLKDDGKWRPDHDALTSCVVDAAIVRANPRPETATTDATRIAWWAAKLMRDLFVSPATLPKKSGLEKLGVGLNEIAHWERKGKKIVVVDTEGEGG